MTQFSRRHFLKMSASAAIGAALSPQFLFADGDASMKTNFILCMTDDQGWGDTGYNGHEFLKTPALDQMATEGMKFNRWYAAAPVCSPTRGSCITGRHPRRYGIHWANEGHLKEEEITLAQALKPQGYVTGHFGKWHLGTLSKTVRDGNRGGLAKFADEYAPPWDRGFDKCFSTESKVVTYWDKGAYTPNTKTKYWTGPDEIVQDGIKGDDSKVIMDRAIPFIQNAVKADQPFLAVIWFHTPHKPYKAGPEHKAMYKDTEDPDYFGCLTAMDDQMARLRAELKHLGIEDNTFLAFTSDNGPEHKTPGSSGGLRDRKRSLYEGGVRVPGLLVWPEMIKQSQTIDLPCSSSDYYPTIMDITTGKSDDNPRPKDGISLLPVIQGKQKERGRAIGFYGHDNKNGRQVALTEDRFKLIRSHGKWELYDIPADRAETTNVMKANTEKAQQMREQLLAWIASCNRSLEGADYLKP